MFKKKGGLFETGDENLEMAFKNAIDWINNNRKLLPNSNLAGNIEKLERSDSFQAFKRGLFFLHIFDQF